MEALIRAAADEAFPAEIVLVLSDRADAPGLLRAEEVGVSTAAVERKGFPSKEAHEAAIHAELEAAGADLVCLAGFMRVLSPGFVARWRGKLLNIHPSLLPEFRGLDTHARALAEGVTEHGCTVHFVSEELDAGPVVAQARVQVLPSDTPETLAARVLEAEHRLYPEALRQVAMSVRKFGSGIQPWPRAPVETRQPPRMKPLRPMLHLQVRMRERNLPWAWIERTVRQALWTEPEPDDPTAERRFAPIPEFGSRILRVVCAETETEIRVITALFDRNARRRL